jgi:hypothetical protein
MRRATATAVLGLLLLSCGEPVEQSVTLTFDESASSVTITAQTKLNKEKPGTPEAALVEDTRSALLAGRDEWAFRFANAEPKTERTSFERVDRELVTAEHSGTIPIENLQRFFSDTPLTFAVTRGEGSAELTIYPGESTRATRLQRQKVEKRLSLFSERAVHYFAALRSMYRYMDANPARAEAMFTVLFEDDEAKRPPLGDDETSHVADVRKALDLMAEDDEGGSGSIDRDFDLAFNPFPAAMTVVVPGAPLAVEGFVRSPDGAIKVEMRKVLDAVASLEGKWVSPDPLATFLASSREQTPADLARSLAGQERKAAEVVRADDVAEAVMQKMRPAKRYVIRWVTKSKTSS